MLFIARVLAVLSVLLTLVAIEIIGVQYLPIGFEATGVFGGYSFILAAVTALSALVIVEQRRHISIAERERQHGLETRTTPEPPTQEHVDRVREAVNDILSGLDRGEDVGERIRSLTDLTGREYIPSDFEEFEGRMSEDDFVREAAL